jgi:hypothetical protein
MLAPPLSHIRQWLYMSSLERTAADSYDYTKAYREYGNGVYLAPGETFEEVVAKDAAILERHDATAEQVGQSLRKLFKTHNDFLEIRAPAIEEPIPGVKLSWQRFLLGYEPCPYIQDLHASIDWRVQVEGIPNGNKAHHPADGPTFVSDMLPAMIEQLGFFEGQVFYGIQPEWAVAIHRLVEEHKPEPYVPALTKNAWNYIPCHFSNTGVEFVAIEENQIATEEIAFGITAIIAPGAIAPWGWDQYTGEKRTGHKYYGGGKKDHEHTAYWATIKAQEDMRIPPDMMLHGMPFEMYSREIRAGRTLAQVFPFIDKQVA